MATQFIYQFHAELEGYKPKIWRRFQVAESTAVARLGYIIMAMYEMKGSHLLSIEHERPLLTASGRKSQRTELIERYDILDEEPHAFSPDGEDATQTMLSELNFEDGSHLIVWYDFGDDWRVKVTLEKKLNAHELPSKELPRVLEGKGFGIVEDCGGIYGLEGLVEAFKAKEGKEYMQFSKWLGVKDFDIAKFDIDDMNFRLKKLPNIFAKIYEQRKFPTKASIDIIERAYLKNKK